MMELLHRKDFTNGFVALLQLDDGKQIETTATCLPLSTEMRGTNRTDNIVEDYNSFEKSQWKEKAMIGVSTQSGCPIRCKFCAVNDLTDRQGWRNLDADEIVSQVMWAVDKIEQEQGLYIPKAKLFRVLFTRMGEPSLNWGSVMEAIKYLYMKFPNIRIQISTIGFGKASIRLMHALAEYQAEVGKQFIELQYSIHSTNNSFREWLQHSGVSKNEEIGVQASFYNQFLRNKGVEVKWKVTLNFALTTETPFDIEVLKAQFNPDDVFIKVSPINENEQTKKNNIEGVILQTNAI